MLNLVTSAVLKTIDQGKQEAKKASYIVAGVAGEDENDVDPEAGPMSGLILSGPSHSLFHHIYIYILRDKCRGAARCRPRPTLLFRLTRVLPSVLLPTGHRALPTAMENKSFIDRYTDPEYVLQQSGKLVSA